MHRLTPGNARLLPTAHNIKDGKVDNKQRINVPAGINKGNLLTLTQEEPHCVPYALTVHDASGKMFLADLFLKINVAQVP